MHTPISLYTALALLPLYLFLSIRVIRFRQKHNVSIGDGGHTLLFRRIRAHGNFAEYAPLGLLLILLLELNGGCTKSILLPAMCLVVGRFFHATALSLSLAPLWVRVTGMALTFASLITSGILLLLKPMCSI